MRLDSSLAVILILCINPQIAMIQVLIPKFSAAGPRSLPAISRAQAQGLLACDVILYLVLFFYLDQVFEQEFGIRKSPLFCLRRPNKCCLSRRKKMLF